METKYTTVPFDIERVKRITNGQEPGKIITRDKRDVRMLCWCIEEGYIKTNKNN